MGRVTDVLHARVRQACETQGIAVLFDPEGLYADAIGKLEAEGVPVSRWEGSFFELRHRLESSLQNLEAPRVLVYLPIEESVARGPLVEVLAIAAVLRPGQQPPARNTRLSVLARQALVGLLPEPALESVVKQAESGALNLSELDDIAEKGSTSLAGALGLVFGTTNAHEITLRFLADRTRDDAILAKSALADLKALASVEFGADLGDATSCPDLAERLGRFLLATEFVGGAFEKRPKGLAAVPIAERLEARERCRQLLQTWRTRTDVRGAYVVAADKVEKDLGIGGLEPIPEALGSIETFRCGELRLLEVVEARLLEEARPAYVELAERRVGTFWPSMVPELMERWALVASAGRLLLRAEEVETEVRPSSESSIDLAARYLRSNGESGSAPWCLLDTAQRHLERRVHHFDFDVTGGHSNLERLIASARTRYARVGALLAGRFVAGLAASKFKVKGLPAQRTTFKRFVEPARATGKCAYLLVDALRWEMARELSQSLPEGYEVELNPTMGTLPSVTEVGMAALLPRADSEAALLPAGSGKVALQIDGKLLSNRKQRLEFLSEVVGGKVHTTRLESLLPPSKKEKEAVGAAAFIVVTAVDELDGLCESGNVSMARRMMDDVLVQIRRGLRVLFDLGVGTVIVASDHGFLFGEALDAGLLIDPPGGQTVDLHRRVWVGKGGAASESYLRLKASTVGLGGDLEIAVPWTLAGFKGSGGAMAYFHGGASPQELLLPVMTVRRKASVAPAGDLAWTLTPGSAALSTRFLSVQVSATLAGLFGGPPPAVRLEIREGKKCLSRAVSAAYGFQEVGGAVEMAVDDSGKIRPNTVTLMIETVPAGKSVDVVLLDAGTDRILQTVPGIPASIVAF